MHAEIRIYVKSIFINIYKSDIRKNTVVLNTNWLWPAIKHHNGQHFLVSLLRCTCFIL